MQKNKTRRIKHKRKRVTKKSRKRKRRVRIRIRKKITKKHRGGARGWSKRERDEAQQSWKQTPSGRQKTGHAVCDIAVLHNLEAELSDRDGYIKMLDSELMKCKRTAQQQREQQMAMHTKILELMGGQENHEAELARAHENHGVELEKALIQKLKCEENLKKCIEREKKNIRWFAEQEVQKRDMVAFYFKQIAQLKKELAACREELAANQATLGVKQYCPQLGIISPFKSTSGADGKVPMEVESDMRGSSGDGDKSMTKGAHFDPIITDY